MYLPLSDGETGNSAVISDFSQYNHLRPWWVTSTESQHTSLTLRHCNILINIINKATKVSDPNYNLISLLDLSLGLSKQTAKWMKDKI